MRLETSAYNGRPAEYLFMLLFNFICILIVAVFSEIQVRKTYTGFIVEISEYSSAEAIPLWLGVITFYIIFIYL